MSRSTNRSTARKLYELLSSMRFAISLLTLLAIASIIGTVVKQNEPYNAYLNQFGPFWFPIFKSLGLYSVYHSAWFLTVLAFLVVSTSLCLVRNTPQMIKDMRNYRENAKEVSLRHFAHHVSLHHEQPFAEAQQKVVDYLKQEGFKSRVASKEDGVLVAAKAGSGNRLGYILAHSAIVLICVGGLFDGDLPLKLQLLLGNKQQAASGALMKDITPANRLGVEHSGYRGNVFLPEGQRSGVAVINIADGILLQDLPFDLELKKFTVEYYTTGAPRRFASDLLVIDRKTGKKTEHTIEVNKPLVVDGVTLYQASFEDGGSKLNLSAHNLSPGSRENLDLVGTVGEATKLTRRGEPLTLEVSDFRALNVETTITDETKQSLRENIASRLGSAARPADTKKFTNIGPSFTYKLRDAAGQAKEFHNYMAPIWQDGRSYFLFGMREASADQFRYLRVPAYESDIATWLDLRAALTNDGLRKQIARRFAARALGKTAPADMMEKLSNTAENTLAMYAKDGYRGVEAFILKTVKKDEQEKAADVFLKVLQGVAWEALSMTREQQHLEPLPQTEDSAAFITDSLTAISDSFNYGAPLLLQLKSFTEVKASVLEATKSPGKNIVFLGSALLVAGVFCMLYIRERRVFVLLKPSGEALLAMSANRQTMALEEAFKRYSAGLADLLNAQKPASDSTANNTANTSNSADSTTQGDNDETGQEHTSQ
jgi:cytochrome c biogenesis protein